MNNIETAPFHSAPNLLEFVFPAVVLATFLVSLAIGGGGLSMWLFTYFAG